MSRSAASVVNVPVVNVPVVNVPTTAPEVPDRAAPVFAGNSWSSI